MTTCYSRTYGIYNNDVPLHGDIVIQDKPGIGYNYDPINNKWVFLQAVATQITNDTINAQIASLEQGSLMNRGQREMSIWQLEDKANQMAANGGPPAADSLAKNYFYNALIKQNNFIINLRKQLK